jgi:hypothetical protein
LILGREKELQGGRDAEALVFLHFVAQMEEDEKGFEEENAFFPRTSARSFGGVERGCGK